MWFYLLTVVTMSNWKYIFYSGKHSLPCIVYFEKIMLCRYVMEIHFWSWKSHGKSLLKKSGHSGNWKHVILKMWANAQRDGRPVEHRWRIFNAAKSGWRSLLDCCVVSLPRRESRWNLQGCPKLVDRSQPLVGRSSPYCGDMWRTHGPYCCLTSFFPIVDTCLSCEDIAR